jgi:glycosyltransferase involved in cell wall biosynthesis
MTGKALLFYNDSEVFGGHEIMTVRIINSLARQRLYTLHCLHHAPDFVGQLDPSVKTYALPFHTKTRTFLMPGTLTRQTTHIRNMINAIAPDLMVVSQGYAESGVRGLLAARRARVKTYSYIPFGNNNTELNNRFARLRDLACKLIYRLPDGYITISSYQASLLQRFTSVEQPIYVINNPADFDYAAPRPNAAYAPRSQLEIAVVGRIVFKQKNQDRLIPMARALSEKMDFRIHIIGDGPDKIRLQDMITSSGLAERFMLHGWMKKTELVPFLAEHIDLILIPSLYEGLPLILLEALYLNKPFVMSDLGLLSEYDVPKDWLFDPHDPADIAGRVAGLGKCFDPEEYALLRRRVLALHSTERFHADVEKVFSALLTNHETTTPSPK